MKKIFLHLVCSFFLFSSHLSYAQSFQRLLGTTSNDEFNSVLIHPNGDYIISGTTMGQGNGGSDILVIRANSDGDIVWQNTYGGNGNESNCVATINNNGNIIIAASSSSYSDSRDLNLILFEIKIDGSVLWSRNYSKGTANDLSDEIPRKISVSPSGLIICATIGAPNSNSHDLLVLELSNDGSIINWQNQIGISTGFGDIPSSIIPSLNGGYIVVGGSFTVNNNYDQLVWRLNKRGALQSNFCIWWQ